MDRITHHPDAPTATQADPDDPYNPARPLPAALKRALDLIDRAVADAVTARAFGPFQNVSAKLTELRLPKELNKTARVYYGTRRRQLLAYLEDPHPYGQFRYDLPDNDAYVANGVLTGRQMERLSQIPQRVRDALQHTKRSGGVLMESHVEYEDHSIPTYLEVPRLQRQFKCPSWAAQELQFLFLRFDANQQFVQQYATEARRRGFDAVFLELDWISLQLAPLNPNHGDALCQADLTSYEEGRTELGRFGDREISEDDQSKDSDWPDSMSSFETVGYHTVHSDHEAAPPDFTHPWIKQLRRCSREQLPSFLQEAYAAQRKEQWNYKLASWFWFYRNEQIVLKAPPSLRESFRTLRCIHNAPDLARYAKLLYQRQGAFTCSEKKLLWTAYNERKKELTPAPTKTPTQTPAPAHVEPAAT